ncbi:hypothetical protein RFI_37071 [Reticulomyxa filosa]|uniref:Uncharacterized protein n=1 Tax=Reticulomyxa filosa TaxID=46433 RepID=X6LGC2_RETFI|nr:hypothetical protein RFI_37071 [Reticulomyxa filosa]|eukprot:ETO00376.1 hypothetical protein RFI_37071 [Reticulomyxa filosa]
MFAFISLVKGSCLCLHLSQEVGEIINLIDFFPSKKSTLKKNNKNKIMKSCLYIYQYLENVCKTSGNRQELLTFLSDLCELKDLREFLEERMARIKKIIEKGDVSGNEEYVSFKSKLHRLYFRISPMEEILPANVLLHFRYKKKKKDNNNNNNNKIKYKLVLKEPDQFEWMHKRKERLHLDLDHAQNMVSIKIDNRSGKTNGMEFFNGKNENSIAKFPWHGIRNWEIEGHLNWMDIWRSFVNKNPILLYRSLFDPNSNSWWRKAVSFWKAYSFANKMQQKKMKRKFRGRNKYYVMKILQKWGEDGIRTGQNHGFIDYSSMEPLTHMQSNVLSNYEYSRQCQFLIQMLDGLKRRRSCCQNFHRLCVQDSADYTHSAHTSPKLFYITIDDNGKTTAANDSHTYRLPFNFYHAIQIQYNYRSGLEKSNCKVVQEGEGIAQMDGFGISLNE